MFDKIFVIFVLGLMLGACSSTHGAKSQGQTHWLEQCDSDADCGAGELTCECGVCVASCGQDGQCSVSGLETECFVASSTAVETLCGAGRPSPPSLCLEACTGSCAEGQVCASGACIAETSTPIDSRPSHWLDRCESDADCGAGELSCECGICAATCAPDGACNVSGLETHCVGPGGAVVAMLCSTESPSLCLEPCSGSPAFSCDVEQVCSWGIACVPVPEPPTETLTLGLRNMKTTTIYVQTEDCNGEERWFDLRIGSETLDVQDGCDCRTADPLNGCPTPPPVCAEPVAMAIEPGGEITYTWDTGYWFQHESGLCSNRFPVAGNQALTYRVCWLQDQPTQDELNAISYPTDFSCAEMPFTLSEGFSDFKLEIYD
jgi:hypothetical protein